MKDLAAFDDIVDSRGVGSRGLPQSQWSEVGDLPVIGQGAEFSEGRTNRIDLAIVPSPALIVYGGHSMRAKFVTEKFVPGPNVKILIPDDRLDCKFLYYFLLKSPIKSKGYADHFTEVRKLEIPLPTLAEQKRIVALLDEAFDGIDAARAKVDANLDNTNALFKSHVQAIFDQGAAGWRRTTLEEISTNLDSKRVPITKNIRTSGDFPYYGASGIVDYVGDYIFEGDNLLVSEDGANLLARSTPIAFSVTGKYWVNNHAHILHFENMATQRFVEFYLESIKLDGFITGAAQPKLTQKALNSIPIPIPESIQEQGAIVRSIESLQQGTEALYRFYEKKINAMKELKSSLLSKAFAGELAS